MSDWTAYLKSVDQTPQSGEVVGQAAEAFSAVGLNEPAAAVGVSEPGVVDKIPSDAVASASALPLPPPVQGWVVWKFSRRG